MGGRPFSDEEQRRLGLRLCLDIGHSERRQFSLTRALNSARSGNQNAARARSVPPASSALCKPVVTSGVSTGTPAFRCPEKLGEWPGVGVGTATNGRPIGSPGSGLARRRTPSTQESSNSSTTLYTEEIETAFARSFVGCIALTGAG